MSVLTDLRAALEAKREAEAALRVAAPKYKDLVLGRAWTNRRDDLYDLLTDDTIAALVAVARAVDKGKLTAARHSLYPLVKEADDE